MITQGLNRPQVYMYTSTGQMVSHLRLLATVWPGLKIKLFWQK